MATQVKNRRGSAADHANFTGGQGEVTVVTDDYSLRVHDGVTAGGNPVGGGSQEVTATGTDVSRSLADRFTDHANVLDYGVVPHPTDSSTADQNALILNRMFNDGVSKFYFPAGYYWIGDTLDFRSRSGVEVVGEGKNRTSVRWFGVSGPGLQLGHPTSYQGGGSIRDINLYGTISSGLDWRDYTYENSSLVELGGMVNQFEVRNVYIAYAEIGIDSTVTSNNWNRSFDNVQIAYTGTSFIANESNANHFDRCQFFLSRDKGVEIEGFGIAFTNTSFESLNSPTGYLLNVASRGVSIDGCYFEGADRAVNLRGTPTNKSKGTSITGSYFTGTTNAGSVGIYSAAASGTFIAGNYIRRFETSIEYEDNTSQHNCEMYNIFEDNTIPQKFNVTDWQKQGNWHAVKLGNDWSMSTNTREGLQASFLQASHTTLNSLNDVRLNDSPYMWRTWLGGRGGTDGGVRPVSDNDMHLGSASYRWGEIYSGNNVINPSDVRLKTNIEDLDAAEMKVAVKLKGLIKKFKWRDSVEGKGEDARIHIGVMAQDVFDTFASEGLDAHKYSLFCYDEWDEELDEDGNVATEAGSIYAIRYNELLSFIIAAI